MPVEPGQILLHYRIVDKLGEGGMGVVWRAIDTTLDREVAIKLLPSAVGDDPERLARFDREAKLLASLNHPNIAGIYGAHNVPSDPSTGSGPSAASVRFLAMELVEGEDLAERLARGPLPVDEAIELARGIAAAFEAAHEAGVIHRDLKPANVKLTPDGHVKVLDFGLAKALSPETAGGSVDLSTSPTLTSAGTVAGMILGTAAYMSPEQAKGKAVDRRADVWSFGCVLYECLTGRGAFQGETLSEILAEVLKGEPDWTALPPSTPPAVRRVLRRCLVKDRRERLRDLGDARLELTDTEPAAVADIASAAPVAPSSLRSRTGALAGWLTAAALLVLLVVAIATRGRETPPEIADQVVSLHAEIRLPDDAELGFGMGALGVDRTLLALSPDGTLLVYVGKAPEGDTQLYRRDLTGFDPAAPIPGTEGAYHAFFSPDGDSIGFVTRDKLKRVAPNGDSLQTIAPITTVVRCQWREDDTIYLGADQGRRLQRVPVSGGRPEELTINRGMVFLEVLPHGRSALVMLRHGISTDYADIALLDLETFETRTILEGGYDARLIASDRLVFARGGNLLAVSFDADEGLITGEPVTVMREVVMDTVLGMAQFAVSDNGTLVFVRGPELSRGGVARIDRDGNHEFLPVEQRAYGVLDLDPTDRRLAIHVADVESYVWTYDIETGRGSRLPGRQTGWPVWSNDGEMIGYNDEVDQTLRIESVGGTPVAHSAIPNEWAARFGTWSPDDRVVALSGRPQGVTRIGFLNLEDGTTEWVDSRGAYHSLPTFSPNGKWVAYSSNETGTLEIWIRSYPDGSVIKQISDGGGLETVWTPSGELFYRHGNRWMGVTVTTEPTLSWSAPRQVFQTDFIDTLGRSFDVSSDGRSLYVVKQLEPPDGTRVHVVTGWMP
ncbi:protein kinase [bacterium]|nr:protein kinase [bacterium]